MDPSKNGSNNLPDRDVDQSTAWERMEEIMADSVSQLPDFPGFKHRMLFYGACDQNDGTLSEDYVGMELVYRFDESASESDLITTTYHEVLKEYWNDKGFEITRESEYGDGSDRTMVSKRPDKFTYVYKTRRLATLTITSGCVKRVDDWKSECIPPLGGVKPEDDYASKHCIAPEDGTVEL
ncbi:hypothetical protein [Haloglycomyces albus]|uniref:hypothetical protein n=1 Tax=Haloglycomyces albus TaxID=526067 RepID=UPI0012ECB7EB|nr:hypothetical protein [Haloglycomyces albus]